MIRLRCAGALAAALFALSFIHPATAQPGFKVDVRNGCVFNNDGKTICGGVYTVDEGRIIGGRPPDCPRSYCGCGLRKYLGLSDKRLNLARNWARLFPRVSGPRAGVAAVRRGHVMYIESSAGDGQWLVRDYNSGGGLSRVHVRDVRGHVFVDPHARIAQR